MTAVDVDRRGSRRHTARRTAGRITDRHRPQAAYLRGVTRGGRRRPRADIVRPRRPGARVWPTPSNSSPALPTTRTSRGGGWCSTSAVRSARSLQASIISSSCSRCRSRTTARNAGCSVDESVERLRSIRDSIDASVALEVTMATAFGCPYDGPVDLGRVVDLAKRVVELGIDGLSLADTIGTAAPSEVRRLVSLVRDDIGELSLGVHLHDTRGLALANALAAIEAGVTRVDASLGGLGGCPFAPGASGNLPIEDLVHALRRRRHRQRDRRRPADRCFANSVQRRRSGCR